MKKAIQTIFIIFFITGLSNVYAQEKPLILQTDWLKTEPGSTGQNIGSKVESVIRKDAESLTIIDLSIPIEDPESIDSIEVLSRQSNTPITQKKNWEWIKNPHDDQYDLRLYLPRKPGLEFRLRLIDNVKD